MSLRLELCAPSRARARALTDRSEARGFHNREARESRFAIKGMAFTARGIGFLGRTGCLSQPVDAIVVQRRSRFAHFPRAGRSQAVRHVDCRTFVGLTTL